MGYIVGHGLLNFQWRGSSKISRGIGVKFVAPIKELSRFLRPPP
jgi:hypothetical protein